jgi:hypothetical protein
MQQQLKLHKQYQPVLLVFVALLLLMVFRQQHCQFSYQDMNLFKWKEIIRGIWLLFC